MDQSFTQPCLQLSLSEGAEVLRSLFQFSSTHRKGKYLYPGGAKQDCEPWVARNGTPCCFPNRSAAGDGWPAQPLKEEPMIDLYGMGSPNVVKIYIALEELGLPYEVVPVDVFTGKQLTRSS